MLYNCAINKYLFKYNYLNNNFYDKIYIYQNKILFMIN